jgi:hypothetical protein
VVDGHPGANPEAGVGIGDPITAADRVESRRAYAHNARVGTESLYLETAGGNREAAREPVCTLEAGGAATYFLDRAVERTTVPRQSIAIVTIFRVRVEDPVPAHGFGTDGLRDAATRCGVATIQGARVAVLAVYRLVAAHGIDTQARGAGITVIASGVEIAAGPNHVPVLLDVLLHRVHADGDRVEVGGIARREVTNLDLFARGERVGRESKQAEQQQGWRHKSGQSPGH